MKASGKVVGIAVAMSLLLGSLGIGAAFAQHSTSTATPSNAQTQVQQQGQQGIDKAGAKESERPEGQEAKELPGEKDQGGKQVQSPSYASSIAVDQKATEGMSEADEAATLQSKATITAKDAEAAALAANPGTTVVKTELDNENGALVYSVELSNGMDVKVDAGNGKILHTEQGGPDQGVAEQGGVED